MVEPAKGAAGEPTGGPARKPATLYDASYAILGGKANWLFGLSLVYLIAFVVLARFRPGLLIARPSFEPYALADLYTLGYLTLAFSLGWWFAVKPLAARLLLDPSSRLVWVVAGIGLAFASFSVFQLNLGHLPLPRPDVAPGLLGAFLLGLTATHVVRARWQSGTAPQAEPGLHQGHVYSPGVRWTTLTLAILLIVVTLISIGQELASYHFLVQGNYYVQAAEKAKDQPETVRREYHTLALSAYERSIDIRSATASTHNSLGVVSAQLGQYRAAPSNTTWWHGTRIPATSSPTSATSPWPTKPGPPTSPGRRSLAISALAARQATDRLALYDLAVEIYDRLISGMAPVDPRIVTIHLLRGGARYEQAYMALIAETMTRCSSRGSSRLGRTINGSSNRQRNRRKGRRHLPAAVGPTCSCVANIGRPPPSGSGSWKRPATIS